MRLAEAEAHEAGDADLRAELLAARSEQLRHGEQGVSLLQYLGTSRFWFESFQNWQSEFLAVFVLVVLSIWLREKGSPESKAVAAAHSETGAS